jgi:hypothetical protein
MEDKNKLLQTYFKTYLSGKKMFDQPQSGDSINGTLSNKEEACLRFKDSLLTLEKIRKEYSDTDLKKYNHLINESEVSCHQYLGMIIEDTIESENIISTNIDSDVLVNSIKTGSLDEIKKIKYGEISFSKKISHGTILHYAIKFSDTSFLKLAFKLGARIDTPDKEGHTLLEYACLEQDPNMIFFLEKYGADMKKHLFFRKSKYKLNNNYDSIDILILLKLIFKNNLSTQHTHNINVLAETTNTTSIINKRINNLKKFLDVNHTVGLNDYTINDLIFGLNHYLHCLPEDSAHCYLDIIFEELEFDFKNKLGCPKNKLEMILVTLVPFMNNFPFNISIDWVVRLELKYLILKILKEKKKLNSINIKTELINEIWNNYISTGILPEDYIGILIYQWIIKIKV